MAVKLGPLVSFRRAFTRLALENPTLEPGWGQPGGHVEAKASQKVVTKYVVLRKYSWLSRKIQFGIVRWNIMFSWGLGYVLLRIESNGEIKKQLEFKFPQQNTEGLTFSRILLMSRVKYFHSVSTNTFTSQWHPWHPWHVAASPGRRPFDLGPFACHRVPEASGINRMRLQTVPVLIAITNKIRCSSLMGSSWTHKLTGLENILKIKEKKNYGSSKMLKLKSLPAGHVCNTWSNHVLSLSTFSLGVGKCKVNYMF